MMAIGRDCGHNPNLGQLSVNGGVEFRSTWHFGINFPRMAERTPLLRLDGSL
jgi:hypothetical protein